MKVNRHHIAMLFVVAVTMLTCQFIATSAQAQSSYFTSRGCVNCHGAPTVATCNGCHHHGNSGLKAVTDKTSYAPGETVSATLSGGSRSGWVRAILYNHAGVQVAVSNGNASGMGGSTTLPSALTASAPTTPGTYTWKMAYFGNQDGTGAGDVHTEVAVNTNSFTVVSAADTAAPVVTFGLPATATSLTVSASLSASDNVAVTGYLINKSATPPAASAAGWSATAPASVTAVAGSNTFYAWAKDAAGNVSAVKSASVTVTLPPAADSAAPVVSFSLPATATSLTVSASLSASDNVAVTGYLINQSATPPAASAAGWSATAPASVTAVAGSNTFYAWAKDAAGNVSAVKSASVTVTLPPAADSAAPVVSFSLPATATSLTVSASLSASDNVAVTGYLINQVATPPAASAAGWSATAPASVTAVVGSNTFYAWAKDAAGNVSAVMSATVSITLPGGTDNTLFTVSTLDNGAVTNKPTLNISGSVIDPDGIKSLTLNNKAIKFRSNGSFSTAITLKAGVNTITLVAIDTKGNQSTDVRTITYDKTAPLLKVAAPSDHSVTADSFITVSGTISESSTVTVATNGASAEYASVDGKSFTATVYLQPKSNTLSITATDLAGNSTKVKRTVYYDNVKPGLSVSSPKNDITTKKPSLVLKGKVKGTVGDVTVSITLGASTYTPKVVKGSFSQLLTFTTPGENEIVVTATDESGSSTVQRTVIYQSSSSSDDDDDDNN